jgi:hypothetical protein
MEILYINKFIIVIELNLRFFFSQDMRCHILRWFPLLDKVYTYDIKTT